MSYNTPYLNNYTNYMNRYSYIPQYQQPILPQVQPLQQPIQQIQPNYEMPIQSIRFVNEAEAKAYMVLPNTKEMLVDKANSVAYIKSADQMGQSSTKRYKFEELVGEDDNTETRVQNEPKINIENYVSKEDAKGFVTSSALEEFSTKLNERLDKLEKKIKISEIMGEK